jgi:hypothetical protein
MVRAYHSEILRGRTLSLHTHTHRYTTHDGSFLPFSFSCSDICVYPRILDETKADDPIDVMDLGETTCQKLQHNAGSPLATTTTVLSIPPPVCPLLREELAETCCVLQPAADGGVGSGEPSSPSTSRNPETSERLSSNTSPAPSPGSFSWVSVTGLWWTSTMFLSLLTIVGIDEMDRGGCATIFETVWSVP